MKIRIKFTKQGKMAYIGHLDIMRYFQKAIRRAELDISFSEGFSPHMIMSFALPLSVGVLSNGEYMDIQMNSAISSKEAIKRLNDVMADGVSVTGFVELPEDAKKSMSIVSAARYTVSLKEEYADLLNKDDYTKVANSFLSDNETIEILKKQKKTEKITDIKPSIYELKVNDNKFEMFLACGSENNLKPDLVMEAIFKYLGIDYNIEVLCICREEMYAKGDGGYVSLLDMGKEIL